jgi:hypothetical protein
MAVASEERDQGKKDGGEHRDSTPTIQSKNTVASPTHPRANGLCVLVAEQECMHSGAQAPPAGTKLPSP